jgi:hypothetical protein
MTEFQTLDRQAGGLRRLLSGREDRDRLSELLAGRGERPKGRGG